MGAVTGQDVAQAFGGLVIEADQAVLTGEYADHVAVCLRAALSSASRAGGTTTWRSPGTGASPGPGDQRGKRPSSGGRLRRTQFLSRCAAPPAQRSGAS